jgi:predicted RNA binding protein YcfA (HicA-like mRNA interferase family)
MPKLRVLSGQEIIKLFTNHGFEVDAQKGSHVKLRRFSASGEKQTLTIPIHKEFDRGTSQAIFRQALRYLSEDDLRDDFYTTNL